MNPVHVLPCPSPPTSTHRASFFAKKEIFLFLHPTLMQAHHGCPPTLCSIFWKTGQCMSAVRPCLCTCLCNMSLQRYKFQVSLFSPPGILHNAVCKWLSTFTAFIIFFTFGKFPPSKQCDRSVIIIIIVVIIIIIIIITIIYIIIITIGSTALGGPWSPRDRSVQGHLVWVSYIPEQLDSVQFLSHFRSLSKRDYTKIQQQVACEICTEICAEANTAHAFEFTAALSEFQDFVSATVVSLFHKFNHSTPCATNVTLPLPPPPPPPRNDGFRIIYWIAPAI